MRKDGGRKEIGDRESERRREEMKKKWEDKGNMRKEKMKVGKGWRDRGSKRRKKENRRYN